MLLVEYTILDKLQVINETTEGGQQRLKLRGRFQKCDEQNNNGRIYPRKILESQVQKIQEKINDRSLVGALDHPANDAIHLSQASHLITGLSVDKSGDVIGECEILSTPNGKIVEALINDGVKIGISSRGVGSVSEGREGKIVNEDFKLITFDLVSDPSTKGAYPELTESIRENSQRAQEIISKHKKDRVLITMLESKINEAMSKKKKKRACKGGRYDEARPDTMAPAGPKAGRAHAEDEARTDETPAQRKARKAREEAEQQKKYRDEFAAYAGKFQNSSTEIDGNSLSEIRGKHALKRTKEAQRAAREVNPRGVSKPFEVSAKTHLKAAKAGRRAARRPLGDQDQALIKAADAEHRAEKQHASTIIDRFADIIRERRCWKGYKPVKGKKPYSKGSCKKEGYEILGKAIVEMLGSTGGSPKLPRSSNVKRRPTHDSLGRPYVQDDDDFDPDWNPNNANDPRNKPQKFRGRQGPVIGSRR